MQIKRLTLNNSPAVRICLLSQHQQVEVESTRDTVCVMLIYSGTFDKIMQVSMTLSRVGQRAVVLRLEHLLVDRVD